MREILFRGKRVDNGEWIKGYYCRFGWTGQEKHYIIPHYSSDGMPMEIDPDTVGQYTGLTDKNGVKIFEGDIVSYQFDNDDCPLPNKNTKKRIGRIFFSDWRASYSVTAGKNGCDSINTNLYGYVRNGNRVEVIGNIRDNPELLEESK